MTVAGIRTSYVRGKSCPFGRWRLVLTAFFVFSPFGAALATEVPKMMPDVCDREWDRIKDVTPINKKDLDQALANPKSIGGVVLASNEVVSLNRSNPTEAQADLYYLLARIPLVVGAEQQPTTLQREEWFERAANLGHKSAKAALMRLRYLSGEIPVERRVDRQDYLRAALQAAEAGDPEFATVLMDTARDTNHAFHCRQEDREQSPTRNGCNPQGVVKPIETRKWAEIAARGGNPHAKNLLWTMHYFGTFSRWGAEQDDNLAFQWCFTTHQTACSTYWNVGILAEMYEKGKGVSVNRERAKEMQKLSPTPRYLRGRMQFPQIAQ